MSRPRLGCGTSVSDVEPRPHARVVGPHPCTGGVGGGLAPDVHRPIHVRHRIEVQRDPSQDLTGSLRQGAESFAGRHEHAAVAATQDASRIGQRTAPVPIVSNTRRVRPGVRRTRSNGMRDSHLHIRARHRDIERVQHNRDQAIAADEEHQFADPLLSE